MPCKKVKKIRKVTEKEYGREAGKRIAYAIAAKQKKKRGK